MTVIAVAVRAAADMVAGAALQCMAAAALEVADTAADQALQCAAVAVQVTPAQAQVVPVPVQVPGAR